MNLFVIAVLFFVCLIVGFILGRITNFKNEKYDGSIEVAEEDTALIYQLELSTPPENLKNLKSVTFQIVKNADPLI